MSVLKRDSLNFSAVDPSRPTLTVWDIVSKIRILSGQKLLIQYENEILAWCNNYAEAQNDKDNPAMQRTVDFVTWVGSQMVIYVGEDGI